jgi:formamidopyrimidine-DNA glycosylase
MESIGKIAKFVKKTPVQAKPDKHLHSSAHLLADELSVKLNDKRHFGFYLKMAVTYDHNFLRKLMGEILENKNVQTPGKLFAYLIKKYNQEKKASS